MKAHEVTVKIGSGPEHIVSAQHYAQNQSEYTLVKDNGWKDKMSELLPDNKKVVATANIQKDKKEK